MGSNDGIEVRRPLEGAAHEVLTPTALAFVADLQRTFGARRLELLARRDARQAELDAGHLPDFLPETAHIRAGDWRVAPVTGDLANRRVEITGPVDRKMVINALNSGATCFMADIEDALAPTWDNLMEGQVNLTEAIERTISFAGPDGREYRLNDQVATIIVRPRGWHLHEKHVWIDGVAISASLFDFGLHFYRNAQRLLDHGSGPYFYLPKMESHLEARLWNDVFVHAQAALGIPNGTIKATVLIETILAAFEMDEILYELRDHSAGLNAGRWDYIFSAIKKMRGRADMIVPDRAAVTMTVPFMRAYTELLVQTCHKRGAFAMGGMAAFIPNRRDPEVTNAALARVKDDKERESRDGFDGTWVAHPDLIPTAMAAFDAVLGDRPNQIERQRPDVHVTAADLLSLGKTPGQVTEAGVRGNVSVGLQYIAAWLGGSGAVAINNLMEEIGRAHV